ncbi:MAG TPA: molybdenum cofactor guanylyltransferase MobA [Rhodospirillales bacterium]|nr:molybdenum cofactor guanylyltransferase MobA [Rhodospirillales bacterium]
MIAGVVLAGGQGRRLGGVDKASARLGGKPLIEHVIDRVSPQVSGLIINAAGDPARFANLELPVVADVVDGFAGPLAGVLTGLEWLQCHRPNVEWLVSFAVDTPFLPGDLVARLATAVASDDADMACARSAGRCHPVIALWPAHLAQELRHALTVEDIRKIDRWTARYQLTQVNFAPVAIQGQTFDPFFNINRPDDLVAAEHLLALMDT